MCSDDLLKLARTVETFEDKEYLISTIAFSAAPTVEGRKPSTIVNLPRNKRNLYCLWQSYKAEVARRLGVSYYELRQNEEGIQVLIYKPDILEKHLQKKSSVCFLSGYGYCTEMSMEKHLEHLKRRYSCGCPHELGVFLGYPVKDIDSFIKNSGKGCLLCRYWKVYHNPRRAKCIFDAYDKAKSKIAGEILDTYRSQAKKDITKDIS